jgi:2'-5' RNA ligase
MKRLFIGIPIHSTGALQIRETWRKDEKLNPNVLKWSDPDNWHVTLVFLGNTPETEIDPLHRLIEESFSEVPSFITRLKGIGVFPNTHNPKVLWLGIEDIQPLMTAQTCLVELLQLHGFAFDNKPLKPHLTLARIRNPEHLTSFESLLNRYQYFTSTQIEINKVILYESVQTINGPVYKPLFMKGLGLGKSH